MDYQYKYCSNCGELFTKVSETLYLCPKCDFRIFLNPKPSSGAILFNEKNQVLLIKRSYDPGKGMWGIPGGFINPGENATESLTRELMEETGLKISKFEYFGSFSGDYLYKGVLYKVVNAIYTANIPENSRVKLSDESLESKFFDIDQIPIELLAPEDLKKAIVELVSARHH